MVLRLAADRVGRCPGEGAPPTPGVGHPDVDGMAWLSALISDVDAHRIHHRLSAAAAADTADAKAKANGAAAEAKASSAAVDTDNPAGGDDRCMDERRADLLVEALLNCRSRNTATHGPDLADHSDAGVTSGPENADIDVNADLHSGAGRMWRPLGRVVTGHPEAGVVRVVRPGRCRAATPRNPRRGQPGYLARPGRRSRPRARHGTDPARGGGSWPPTGVGGCWSPTRRRVRSPPSRRAPTPQRGPGPADPGPRTGVPHARLRPASRQLRP